MIPARNPVKFYWQVVDYFFRAPGAWRFLGTRFQVESVPPTKKSLLLTAIITAGLSYKSGKYTMAARVQVKGGTTAAFSRSALRELAEVGLLEHLQRHGFRWRDEPLPYYPLGAWKSVDPGSFASERRFLSELTGKRPGVLGRRAPRSLRMLVEGFRGRNAGVWRPVNAEWELRRAIRISGRHTTAICKFHIVRADREGRLGVFSSITIWPPFERKGPLPAWLSNMRETLDSQYRAAGHKAEWHRGPRGRGVMITSMREDLRGLADVVRERRVLERAHLGDP